MNRRVESIEFGDHQSLIRNVSIDLTLPESQMTVRRAPAGSDVPLHVLPLAVMRKEPLRNFSLVDNDGALPMLVADENARVAMAILCEMARVEAPHLRDVAIPDSVARDFWLIARGQSKAAEAVWSRLGLARTEEPGELAWREAMYRKPPLQAFAYDCARHFLVLTPIAMTPGERRVIKLGYEERLNPFRPPLLTQVRQGAASRRRKRRARAAVKTDARETQEAVSALAAKGGGVAYLLITVSRAQSIREAAVRHPMPNVRVRVRIADIGDHEGWTDGKGKLQVRVPAGKRCVIEAARPTGAMGTSGPQVVVAATGASEPVDIVYLEIAPESTPEGSGMLMRLLLTLARNLGLSRHVVLLSTSAVKQADTWHMDAQCPDGVIVTDAQLVTSRIESENGQPRYVRSREVSERTGLQRTHLHISNVDKDDKPKLTLRLLPRSSTIAAPACLVAALTAVLLGVVASSVEDVGPNGGSLATVLLFVTGPLSAYLGRPLEHGMTSMLAGAMRVLAVAAGVAGVAGAMLVLLARDWQLKHDRLVPQDVDAWLATALRGLSWFAFACAATAAAAWLKAIWVTRRLEDLDDGDEIDN
ncbi:MAG TPA: hypothetical protein VEW67_06870 [Thermoleophilaceae bacterium]|nr:hypothetical protein [Thermoleophilaceae bacterium]